jgi:hypothetical protein
VRAFWGSCSVLALLALLAAPPAFANECNGQLSPAERALREAVNERHQLGFRSDQAYVQRLLGSGAPTVEADGAIFPVTAREKRYVLLRERLDLGAKGRRYLARRPAIDAGWSIVDAWPRDPYVLVHVAADPAPHRAALERIARFPTHLRVERVRFNERQLRRVQNRVDDAGRALRTAGFTVEGTGVDDDSNRVEVELVTRRGDAAAYFRKRFGPIKTVVIATEPTELACTQSGAYEIAPDGMSLTVYWTTGGGAKFDRIEVTELADRVEIGVVERVPVGARTLEAIGAEAPAALSAPLGARPVIDAADGERMLQHGPSPGDPPCPVLQPPTPLEQAIQTRSEYGMRADARINADARAGDGFFDGYGRAGFLVGSADGHDQTADVTLSVITARTDAAAYFASRYGPLVDVTVVGDRFECAGSYRGL